MPGSRLCPVCQIALSPQNVGPLEVDTCPRCAGVFFDQGELGHAVKTGALPTIESQATAEAPVQSDPRARPCPSCGGAMQSYRYAYSSPIVLDSCESCGGIWADDGELQAMAEFAAAHHGPTGTPPVTSQAALAAAQLDSMTQANRVRTQVILSAVGFLTQPTYGRPFWRTWF